MILTARDTEILETLRSKTRALTLVQIADLWWPHSKRRTGDAANRLRKLPVVLKRTAMTAVPVNEPHFRWSPDNPHDIPFERISYKLRSRWKKPTSAVVVMAADRRHSPERQLTHDVHVGGIYLKHYYPDLNARWTHEDDFQSGHTERPDALVRSGAPAGRDLLIDFGGSYSAAKLRAKHQHFKHAHYEIW